MILSENDTSKNYTSKIILAKNDTSKKMILADYLKMILAQYKKLY